MSDQLSDPESMTETEEEQMQTDKDALKIDEEGEMEDESNNNYNSEGGGTIKAKKASSPMAKLYDEYSIDKADQHALTKQYNIIDFRSLMARKADIKDKKLRLNQKKTMQFLTALVGYLDFKRKRENIDGNRLLRKTTRAEIVNFLVMYAAGNTAGNRAAGGGGGGSSRNSFGKTKNLPLNIFNLPTQGFHPIQDDDTTDDMREFEDPLEEPASDEDFRLYHDGSAERRFEKGACYKYEKEKGVSFTIGIKSFSKNSEVHANCVRIMAIEETLLGAGSPDDIEDWVLPLCPSKHVQVRGRLDPIPFSDFGDLIPNISVPKLIYEPQQIGSKQAFGYVFDHEGNFNDCLGQRDFNRHPVNVIELFCAAGGMHEGYKSAGFTTIKAVDKCPIAISSFRKNNPDTPAEENCVNNVLSSWTPQEDVHILHTSSPCCGFSRINRGGVNDEANNELSYTFYQGTKKYEPMYGVFENVEGMWSEQGMPYLRHILKELLKMKYQFRVMILRACDYGDAQKRPRLFIFTGKHNLPLPTRPPATHGTKPGLLPFVKVGHVLKIFEHLPAGFYPNMEDRRESSTDPLDPSANEGSYVLLKADELAGATRAKGPPVFHPDGKRCVSVRETAALMSFPHDHEFLGTVSQKYVQVGNAVPCCLAKAVAGAFRQCLRMVYTNELDKLVVGHKRARRDEEQVDDPVESDKATGKGSYDDETGQGEIDKIVDTGNNKRSRNDEEDTDEQVELDTLLGKSRRFAIDLSVDSDGDGDMNADDTQDLEEVDDLVEMTSDSEDQDENEGNSDDDVLSLVNSA